MSLMYNNMYYHVKVSGIPNGNKLITSETISDSAECYAGLSHLSHLFVTC